MKKMYLFFIICGIIVSQTKQLKIISKINNEPIADLIVTVNDIRLITNDEGIVSIPESFNRLQVKINHVSHEPYDQKLDYKSGMIIYLNEKVYESVVEIYENRLELDNFSLSEKAQERIKISPVEIKALSNIEEVLKTNSKINFTESLIDNEPIISILGTNTEEVNLSVNGTDVYDDLRRKPRFDFVPTYNLQSVNVSMGESNSKFASIDYKLDLSNKKFMVKLDAVSNNQLKFGIKKTFAFDNVISSIALNTSTSDKAISYRNETKESTFNIVGNNFGSVIFTTYTSNNHSIDHSLFINKSNKYYLINAFDEATNIYNTIKSNYSLSKNSMVKSRITFNMNKDSYTNESNSSSPSENTNELNVLNAFSGYHFKKENLFASGELGIKSYSLNRSYIDHLVPDRSFYFDPEKLGAKSVSKSNSSTLGRARLKFIPEQTNKNFFSTFEVNSDYEITSNNSYMSSFSFKFNTEFSFKGRRGNFYTSYSLDKSEIQDFRKMLLVSEAKEEFEEKDNILLSLNFYLNPSIKLQTSYSTRTYNSYLYNIYDKNLYFYDIVDEANFSSMNLGFTFEKNNISASFAFISNSTESQFAFPLKPKTKGLFNFSWKLNDKLSIRSNVSHETDKEIIYFISGTDEKLLRRIDKELDISLNILFNDLLYDNLNLGLNFANLTGEEKYTINGYFTDQVVASATMSFVF